MAGPKSCSYCTRKLVEPKLVHPMFVYMLARHPPQQGVSTFLDFSKNPFKACSEQNRERGFASGSRLSRGGAGFWRLELMVKLDFEHEQMVKEWRSKHGHEKRMVWAWHNAARFCTSPPNFYVRDADAFRKMLQS